MNPTFAAYNFLLKSLTWLWDSSLQLLSSWAVWLYRNCPVEEGWLDFLSWLHSTSNAWTYIYNKNRRIKAHLTLSFNSPVPSKSGICLHFYSLATFSSAFRHIFHGCSLNHLFWYSYTALKLDNLGDFRVGGFVGFFCCVFLLCCCKLPWIEVKIKHFSTEV